MSSDHDILTALNRDYIDRYKTATSNASTNSLRRTFTAQSGPLAGGRAGFWSRRQPVAIRTKAEDVLIRIIGDVAIIHARTSYLMPDGSTGGGRYTDVWARIGGQWLAVSAHVTR